MSRGEYQKYHNHFGTIGRIEDQAAANAKRAGRQAASKERGFEGMDGEESDLSHSDRDLELAGRMSGLSTEQRGKEGVRIAVDELGKAKADLLRRHR
jgi:hypothetical protein